MQISDWINVALCVLSFLLAVISVVTVVITLRQNSKMIEASTRPYITAKFESIVLCDGVARYVAVKNYGQTGARIIDIKNARYQGEDKHNLVERINDLKGTFLAPSQSILIYIGGPCLLPEGETLQFDMEYSTGKKVYSESSSLRLTSGSLLRRPTEGHAVSFALQEIAERLL